MSDQPRRGISRAGLDAAFEAEEAAKSNLLIEARLHRGYGRHDEAATKLAEAAPIEERLTRVCLEKGLLEKAWVHWFSAISCWAGAGNYYAAIRLGDEMLARPDLPERQRRRLQEYIQSLRARRASWTTEPSSQGERVNGTSTPTVMRDERTGETYLKVPVPDPSLVEPALKAVGTAMAELRR